MDNRRRGSKLCIVSSQAACLRAEEDLMVFRLVKWHLLGALAEVVYLCVP